MLVASNTKPKSERKNPRTQSSAWLAAGLDASRVQALTHEEPA
jgi:hypothetical protein